MAALTELAGQGDPGSRQGSPRLPENGGQVRLMGPQRLYELWEGQHWQSQRLDLSRDRDDWESLPQPTKEEALWALSPFFIGEERVATQFAGLLLAYEDEQEEAFLATQQVDEARHMQFFDRFFREVVGVEELDLAGRLRRAREPLTEAFGRLFDEALVEAGSRLIEDPTDVVAKVEFVTTYHMVIEGALALTGQHYITDYFEKEGLLPGFVEGFQNIARDEHRHVAYGTWFLQRTAGADEALARRMQAKLGELIPIAAGVLTPPGYEVGEEYEILGYGSAEVNEFAFRSLSRRLKAIGVPLQGEAVAA